MFNKRILITGGTGLVGQALLNALEQQGAQVTILSRQKNKAENSIQVDFLNPTNLDQACLNQQIIFHCASYVAPKNSADPEQGSAHFKITVEGTKQLLNAAIKNKVKQFIFISSSRAIAPINDYGRAKQQAEQLLLAKKDQINISILRLPAVYTDQPIRAIGQIYHRILNNKLPPLPDMKEQRSFIHLDDVIHALLLIAEKPQAIGQIYQVTDGEVYSFYQIQQMIRKQLNKPAPKIIIPYVILQIMATIGSLLETTLKKEMPINLKKLTKLNQSTWIDDQKIRQELGYQEEHHLNKIIKNF